MRVLRISSLVVTVALAILPAQQTPPLERAAQAMTAGDFESAATAYEQAIRGGMKSGAILLQLGLARYQQGAYPAAAKAFREALRLQADLAPARALLGLSEAALGQTAASLPSLEASFQARPPLDPELRRLVGMQLSKAYARLGRQGDAEPVYGKLLAEFPDDPELLYQAFWLHMTRGRELLSSLLRAAPDSYRTHLLLGYLLLDKENYAGAEAQFRQALQANAKAPGVHYEIGNAILGGAQNAEARARARVEFEKELEADRAHGPSYCRLADIAYADGEPQRALELYRQAAAMDAKLASAPIGMCKVVMQQERYTEALPWCEKGSALAPENRDAHYRLARIYQKLGRQAEAERSMATFRRLDEQARREEQLLLGARLAAAPAAER